MQVGINPRNPISITSSPIDGSYLPSPVSSFHSKLLFIDNDNVIVMSLFSRPVISNGVSNFPVTTHDPSGVGEVAFIGFGTVVALAGACPDEEQGLLSKAYSQQHCGLFAFTGKVELPIESSPMQVLKPTKLAKVPT